MLQSIAHQETKVHGKVDFPYIVYHSHIPQDFSVYAMHWHSEFEIIYVLEGCIEVNVQAINYICNPGDIIIIPPDYIHEIKQHENMTGRYCNILFKLNLLEVDIASTVYLKYFIPFLNKERYIEPYVKSDSPEAVKLKPYLEYLFNTRHEKYSTEELMIKSNLYAIMYNIQWMLKQSDESSTLTQNMISRIKPVLELVQKNYKDDITIKMAADYINVSESHFMNIFKKTTGNTFINYLIMVRLQKAHQLLIETDMNISQICEQTGFKNLSYFIRAFKSGYGFSPLKYKKLKNQLPR